MLVPRGSLQLKFRQKEEEFFVNGPYANFLNCREGKEPFMVTNFLSTLSPDPRGKEEGAL